MNKFELAIQSEQLYLGSILLDSSLMEEAALSPKHFTNLQNKELYRAMILLKRQGEEVNLFNLTNLGESTVMKFGGTSYLSDLMGSVPSIHAFKSYEKHIRDFYTIQAAHIFVNEFLEKTTETANIQQLTELLQKVGKLETDTVKKSFSFREQILKRYEEHLNAPQDGLSGTYTGFHRLNHLTDGWQPGDLIIIGARPSMGKTAFALNSMMNGCRYADIKATFFSIEMTEGAIIDRLIATEAEIDLMKMRNPFKHFADDEKANARYAKAIAQLEKYDLDIRPDNNVPDMRAVLRRNVKEYPDKKHVAFIDFLTLIKATEAKDNRNNEVESIVLDLKQMAKDLGIPVIVLAQLSRGVESRADKRPMLSDLRESGAIEQTADLVAFLYRDDYYNPETERPGITELLIAKNRNGPVGLIEYKFEKQINRFTELPK